MNNSQADYIDYRMKKASASLADAKLLSENGSWNAAINRLYYACYYAVSALMLQNQTLAKSHAGLKTQFNLEFIKSGVIDKKYGKMYSDLMDWRQKGDYGDMFDFDREAVLPLFVPVEQFIEIIRSLLEKQKL